MSNQLHEVIRSNERGEIAFGAAVIGLVVIFWTSVELQSLGTPIGGVRAIAGIVLLLFVPGAILTRLFGFSTDRFGPFILFSVGFSFTVLVSVTLLASSVLPALGIVNPFSFLPLASILLAVLTALLLLGHLSETTVSIPRVRLSGPIPVILVLFALPSFSAAAVIGMEQFGTNLGMGLFVATVVGVVVLASTRYLPPTLYPLALFSVSISTLFHRNLLTDHVIGADIQVSYFISELVLRTHHWAPDMGGSMMVLAVVTSVPATFTAVTGVELAATFKVIYAFAFSLVPVGIFYATRRLFDDHVAFFGGLFFIIYHGSFYFTPGKQLLAELFVVIMILVFVQERDTRYRNVALFVLLLALVFSHYGMTYVFGASLLVAYAGLEIGRRVVGDFDHRLSIWHPLAILATATAVYSIASPELIVTIGSIPLSLLDQLVTFVLTGVIPGSGASYAQNQAGLLSSLNLLVYLLLTAFVGLGLAWDSFTQLARIRRGEPPERIEYIALAVPLFGLLFASYFVAANLWADRVYQLVLTILSPYAAFGYTGLLGGLDELGSRIDAVRIGNVTRVSLGGGHWTFLAVLLGVLLTLNSGLAFSLAGTAQLSTFNAEANDLAFSTPEREAAHWLEGNVERIEQYDELRPRSDETEETGDFVYLYTDYSSFQLFRAVTLPGYTNVELEVLKGRWQPTVYPEAIGDGYVFIRERSVSDVENSDEVTSSSLSPSEVEEVVVPRNVIYTSNAARIAVSNNSSIV